MGNASVAINGKEDQGSYFFYLLLLILTLLRVADIKKISFNLVGNNLIKTITIFSYYQAKQQSGGFQTCRSLLESIGSP